MIDLSSFSSPLNIAIIGASGGIGQALVQALQAHPQVEQVYGFARKRSDKNSPDTPTALDITDEDSIQQAAKTISAPLDLVIVASGLLHDSTTTPALAPEKSLRDLNPETITQVMAVNTLGPALVAKHFIPLMKKRNKSVFAALSARVGSIGDNRLGGWYSYRASKAALNMLLKTAAIETARRNKNAVIVGLHPGTVDSKLSLPFQKNVAPDKLFSPSQAADYLLQVINQLTPADSGNTFAWDGQEITP